MAQEHVVEVVVNNEQLLGQLLVGDPRDELQDPLLHGSACAVELLWGKEVRGPRLRDLRKATSGGPGSRLRDMSWQKESFPNLLQGSCEFEVPVKGFTFKSDLC